MWEPPSWLQLHAGKLRDKYPQMAFFARCVAERCSIQAWAKAEGFMSPVTSSAVGFPGLPQPTQTL